jgi:hypothetical protein
MKSKMRFTNNAWMLPPALSGTRLPASARREAQLARVLEVPVDNRCGQATRVDTPYQSVHSYARRNNRLEELSYAGSHYLHGSVQA